MGEDGVVHRRLAALAVRRPGPLGLALLFPAYLLLGVALVVYVVAMLALAFVAVLVATLRLVLTPPLTAVRQAPAAARRRVVGT